MGSLDTPSASLIVDTIHSQTRLRSDHSFRLGVQSFSSALCQFTILTYDIYAHHPTPARRSPQYMWRNLKASIDIRVGTVCTHSTSILHPPPSAPCLSRSWVFHESAGAEVDLRRDRARQISGASFKLNLIILVSTYFRIFCYYPQCCPVDIDEFWALFFQPMFPEDPGAEEVRSTVHGWRLTRAPRLPW